VTEDEISGGGPKLPSRRAATQIPTTTTPLDTRNTTARADLRALEEHVNRVLAAAPPLTPEQIEAVAALLRAGRAA
jgi:hypothetical protein